MKKNLLLVLSFTLLISCNNKKDNLKSINDKDIIEYNDSLNIINETIINKDKIKEYFKNYIETDVEQDYYISEENVRLAMPIIYTSLKNNGFAFLDSARFYNRIDEIFSINENTKNPLIINHSNFYTYIDPNCRLSDPKDIALVEYLNNNNIYIIKKYHFIMPLPILEDLVEVNGDQIKLKVSSTIVHRNKYLFNDSQASLTWLINNDSQFLESLVKTFGYVQDKKLLKWIIDRNRFEIKNGKTNGAEYSKILWSRDCSGGLNFHKEILVVMKENLTANSPIYLYDLLYYIDYLTEKKESQEELSLSFEEKAHIIGNILYFVQSMAKEKEYEQFEFRAMGRFYKFHDHKNEYDNEFAKKNYYGLEGFKEMWEQAKDDGDGITYYS